MWLMAKLFPGVTANTLITFVSATPIQFYVGKRFYIGSWKALRRYRADMNVLIALGTSCAYFYSLFATLYAIINSDYEGTCFYAI
jgi:Cu+-exporting ATPase